MMRDWKKWWAAALVRSLKTIAQTAVGMISVGLALDEVQWLYVGSVSLTAGILSVLTSLAGLPEVELERRLEQVGDGYSDDEFGPEGDA